MSDATGGHVARLQFGVKPGTIRLQARATTVRMGPFAAQGGGGRNPRAEKDVKPKPPTNLIVKPGPGLKNGPGVAGTMVTAPFTVYFEDALSQQLALTKGVEKQEWTITFGPEGDGDVVQIAFRYKRPADRDPKVVYFARTQLTGQGFTATFNAEAPCNKVTIKGDGTSPAVIGVEVEGTFNKPDLGSGIPVGEDKQVKVEGTVRPKDAPSDAKGSGTLTGRIMSGETLLLQDENSPNAKATHIKEPATNPLQVTANSAGKGSVKFTMLGPAEGATYPWVIKTVQGDTLKGEGMLKADSVPPFQGLKSDLAPDEYYLHVSKEGNVAFERRIYFSFSRVQFIQQDNSTISYDPRLGGDGSCLMVSKLVTDQKLPASATFDGPAPNNPDLETYRIQVWGLPANKSPKIRLKTDNADSPYEQQFEMESGEVGGATVYRTKKYFRLVSDAADDAHQDEQTVLVKALTNVKATVASTAWIRMSWN